MVDFICDYYQGVEARSVLPSSSIQVFLPALRRWHRCCDSQVRMNVLTLSADVFPLPLQPGYLQQLLPGQAPDQPHRFSDILRDVKEKILPGVHPTPDSKHGSNRMLADNTVQRNFSRSCDVGMTHWQSPNFFAYFPANSSFPGILGEMLSAAFNIVGFSWRGCPAATDLETVRSQSLPQLTQQQPIASLLPCARLCPPPGYLWLCSSTKP